MAALADPPSYTVTPIGLPAQPCEAEYSFPLPRGINASDQVTGVYCRAGLVRGFRWDRRGIVDLGVPPGFPDVSNLLVLPAGINAKGDVAGTVSQNSGLVSAAFLWHGGTMAVIDNQAMAMATAINAAGEVAGFFPSSGGYGAFLYSHGKIKNLGKPPGATGIRAFAINDQGHIAGEADFPSPPLINSPLALWTGARWKILGSVPGDAVEAAPFSINAFDEIVGFSVFPGGFRAFLWNGHFSSLPCVPGAFCEAVGINDAGTIVGEASNGTPIVWTKEVLYDLSTLIHPKDLLKGRINLNGVGINGINNRGTIVAVGQYQSGPKVGQVDVFVLTPVEEVANR